jgi:hypothetical protein
MSDWFHTLPVAWMFVLTFGLCYVAAALIYSVIMLLAKTEWIDSFRHVSTGFLSPMGVIFGLFVAFTAVQVWNDNDHASAAVDREATALKSVLVLDANFSQESQGRLRSLIADHIQEAVNQEWPMLAHRNATISMTPQHLAEALHLTLDLTPTTAGQQIALREMAQAIEVALEARRQRILISRSEISALKWTCLLIEAACVLIAIGLVHSQNRRTAAITMGVFATGLAACLVLIAGYDRPFVGELAVSPNSLQQVLPDTSQAH